MISRFATRRTRLWAVTLTLVANVGGGPMAWAHLAAGGHCHAAANLAQAAPAPQDCPEHRRAPASHESKPANPLPCCDGGSCACAASPAPLIGLLSAPTDLRHDTWRAPVRPALISPDPLDDTLRPPIR